MPENLPPGVYVEDVSHRSRTIEGVSTSTTGFVGPTRYGPLDTEPQLITSLAAFERRYGGGSPLEFTSGSVDNYMWNAARALFENGGKRLYVSRVFKPVERGDGRARCSHDVDVAGTREGGLGVRARYPGAAGNCAVTLTLELSQNMIIDTPVGPGLLSLSDRDVVVIDVGTPASHGQIEFCLVRKDPLTNLLTFRPLSGGSVLTKADLLSRLSKVQILTASVRVEADSRELPPFLLSGLPLDPRHTSKDGPDSIFAVFAEEPAYLAAEHVTPVVISSEDLDARQAADGLDGLDVLRALTDSDVGSPLRISLAHITTPGSEDPDRSLRFQLSGGNDGEAPAPAEYAGTNDIKKCGKGLRMFEEIQDISIVAAPGASLRADDASHRVIGHLINHAEKMRHRIAIVDSGKNQSISEVRNMRAMFDSSHAAFYYPWVTITNPTNGAKSHQPPSGFVGGIYARSDVNRGVHKAPANEVVRLAVGFEVLLDMSQQELLNPEGVNCFRFFEGRGMRLWGARTMSSDPEVKYVNVRRYSAYLERSIEQGLQWVELERNDERLWASMHSVITDFLQDEWRLGGLQGDKPDEAFFVRCDHSTISQVDLDECRVTCDIGIAIQRPAEFTVLRLCLQTASG